MRMLDDLNEEMDEIERTDEWEAEYVRDLTQRKEKNPDYKLSGKQFEILTRIHRKYIRKTR